jgi:hypothetical protein
VTQTKHNADLELQWICRSVLNQSFPSLRGSEINASFYSYIGLTHTIRKKGSRWMIRISDHCRQAPRAVLEAVIYLLACKITHRRPPADIVETYERFRKLPLIESIVDERRARQGRKIMAASAGRHHSLQLIYCELNEKYFNNQIDLQKIGWGLRRGWSRLGHYDPVHHTVTLSPVLDSPVVPYTVLALVVYHEMLHALFESERKGKSRRHHTTAFRKAEMGFEGYQAARKFLNEFCAAHGRLRRS